jgi:hypothetical protein
VTDVNDLRSQARQILGSLIAAAVIVAVAILVVTAKFGPTSTAELDAREEIAKERADAREERLEAIEERREERREEQ